MAQFHDAIIIPEGATNGDMVKAMFPRAEVTRVTDTYVYVENIDSHLPLEIFKNWWNAPYKPVESSKNIENEE